MSEENSAQNLSERRARRLVIAAALGSVIGLGTLGAAYTQAGNAAEPGHGDRYERLCERVMDHVERGFDRMGPGRHGGIRGEFGEHIEGRLAFLKTELKITDAQTKVWNTFAETMREITKEAQVSREDMRSRMKNFREDRGEHREETVLDRLTQAEQMIERSQSRLEKAKAQQKKVRGAIEPLYAALSDEQKKLADDLLRVGGSGGKDRHHG